MTTAIVFCALSIMVCVLVHLYRTEKDHARRERETERLKSDLEEAEGNLENALASNNLARIYLARRNLQRLREKCGDH